MSNQIDDETARALAEAHDRGEVLIAAALLMLIGVFLGMYAFAPKAFSNVQAFESVPIIFCIYTPLVLSRLFFAWRRRLTGLATVAFSTIDVTALSVLIFSWHIQYGQSAPFYLKTPTFAAFFIFIALRALSYRWRFLAFTGVLSAAAWAALASYAWIATPEGRTRDFVTYATSNSLLVGAEVERVLTLLAVTGILIYAVSKKRQLLLQSLATARLNQTLFRFFSPDVAKKIRERLVAFRPGHGEKRRAAVMMIDLRGFTTLASQMSADDVISLVADYQARMMRPIFDHGGSIDKFLGDGIMANWGAAVPSSSAAADCLRAVDALGDTILLWNNERDVRGLPPLRIGIGCAIGNLVFGVVGDQNRMELTSIGEPVNLAAKLEKHTKSAGAFAVATEELVRESHDIGYTSRLSSIEMKDSRVAGVESPIDIVTFSFAPAAS